jgi:hypothetical protein
MKSVASGGLLNIGQEKLRVCGKDSLNRRAC